MARIKLTVAVFVAAALILAAGGAAVASNMGFKLNKALFRLTPAVSANAGVNWTAIPLNFPGNGQTLCGMMGLPGGTSLFQIDDSTPPNGATVSCTCPLAACANVGAGNVAFATGHGVRIQNGTTAFPAFPAATSGIIVGSHNQTQVITLRASGPVNKGNLWFSVPYHTTAINAQDLCTQMGVPTGGASIQIVHAGPTASLTTPTCGLPAASGAAANLVLGEAVRVRTAGTFGAADRTFIPAHF